MLIIAGTRTPQEQCSLKACAGIIWGSGELVHKAQSIGSDRGKGTYDRIEFSISIRMLPLTRRYVQDGHGHQP